MARIDRALLLVALLLSDGQRGVTAQTNPSPSPGRAINVAAVSVQSDGTADRPLCAYDPQSALPCDWATAQVECARWLCWASGYTDEGALFVGGRSVCGLAPTVNATLYSWVVGQSQFVLGGNFSKSAIIAKCANLPRRSPSMSASPIPSPSEPASPSTSNSLSASQSGSASRSESPSISSSRSPGTSISPSQSQSQSQSNSLSTSPRVSTSRSASRSPSPQAPYDICTSGTFNRDVEVFPKEVSRGKYRNLQKCVVLLKAPPGNTIAINFSWISTEACSPVQCDFVRIYESEIELPERIIYEASGFVPPPQIFTTGNVALVAFIADEMITYDGFSFQYYRGNDICLGQDRRIATTSPAYLHQLDRVSPNCTTLLTTASSGTVVIMEFTTLTFGSSDNLTVYDGSSPSSAVLFTGNNPLPNLVSSGSDVLLVWTRGPNAPHSQWNLTFYEGVASASPSPAVSQSPGASWTPSATASRSRPASATPSPTASASQSVSQSRSQSQSPSGSQSISQSGSQSGSQSPSTSASQSQSKSPSKSASNSRSPSQIPSQSPSQEPSPSKGPSFSPPVNDICYGSSRREATEVVNTMIRRPYGPGDNCSVLLFSIPNTGIFINIAVFDAGPGDEIRVYDGADASTGILLWQGSGLNKPTSPLYAESNVSLVTWTSDDTNLHGSGWSLDYARIRSSLDQSQYVSDYCDATGYISERGQSFQPSWSSNMVRIGIRVATLYGGELILRLYEGAGLNSSSLIHSQLFTPPTGGVDENTPPLRVTLSQRVFLDSSRTYTFSIAPRNDTMAQLTQYIFCIAADTAYVRGSLFVRGASNFTNEPDKDMAFETFMEPPAPSLNSSSPSPRSASRSISPSRSSSRSPVSRTASRSPVSRSQSPSPVSKSQSRSPVSQSQSRSPVSASPRRSPSRSASPVPPPVAVMSANHANRRIGTVSTSKEFNMPLFPMAVIVASVALLLVAAGWVASQPR